MHGLRFLPLLLLVSVASAALTKEEQGALGAARQARSDAQFDLAEARFQTFLKRYPTSEAASEARLRQAEAGYYLGHYEAAAGLLETGQWPDNLKIEAKLLQIDLALALQKWSEAEQAVLSFLQANPKNEAVPVAQLKLAWALLKQKKIKDGLTQLELVAKSNSPATPSARLALAKLVALENNHTEAAGRLRQLIDSQPSPALAWEAYYWLAEMLRLSGQPKSALDTYLNITSNDRAFPKDLVARSWFGQGRAQVALNQPEAAQKSFQKAYLLGESEPLKLSAFSQYLECAKALKRLDEAVAELREFAQTKATPPNAAAALYAIGLAQSENNDTDKAVASLEALLTAYPESRWRLEATYELGKSYQQLKKISRAIKTLRACLEAPEVPEIARKASFQLGEIAFSDKDYALAAQHYEKATAPTRVPDNERSLYNLLLCQSQLSQLDSFNKTFDRFVAEFPASLLLDKLTLEKASLLTRLAKPDEAQATFEKALAAGGRSTASPLFLLRLGDLCYNQADYDRALKAYDNLVTRFPNHPLVGQAQYRSLLTSLNSGRFTTDQARLALQNLLNSTKTEPLAPQLLFTLGEIEYNQQRFAEAQARFEQLARDFPNNADADEARFWAAKASIAREESVPALQILEKIADSSPRKAEARLLQARIYREQLKFTNALTVVGAVLDTEKTGARFAEATLLKGDCLFALGKDNVSQYEAAASAYGTLLTTPQGSSAQRNEAGYKRARSFEMLGRVDDALALYLDVLAGRLQPEAPAGKPTPPRAPEYLWTIQAGVKAAQIRENRQDWRGAIDLYRRLEALGGPDQAVREFRDSINKIRRDNFIYD